VRGFSDIISQVKRDLNVYMSANKLNYYELYTMVDKNNDEQISRKEFKDWLNENSIVKLNNNELKIFLDHFDRDKDGLISINEFHNMVKMNQNSASYMENRPSINPLSGSNIGNNAYNGAVKLVRWMKGRNM